MDAQKSESQSLLGLSLAEALPAGIKFTVHHLSSPPTRCSAIFAAPPNAEPERTYCENHFLVIAIQHGYSTKPHERSEPILVLAVEVLIYTTSSLTTLFVAKADSTGFLHLVCPARDTPSPFRTITSTFLDHLVRTKKRSGVKLVISLFASAQDQYLFPGSSEYEGKHVLDHRQLIKWWIRVLDPVMRNVELIGGPGQRPKGAADMSGALEAQGYIVVPGLDRRETECLLPPSVRSDPPESKRWALGHPLRLLSTRADLPPKCLIPYFPDDPKARFMDQLDEELLDATQSDGTSCSSRDRTRGRWKGARTLEEFWEAMEFRQECSSGRLVGFIWVLFPGGPIRNDNEQAGKSDQHISSTRTKPLQQCSLGQEDEEKRPGQVSGTSRSSTGPRPTRPLKLSGPVIPRLPRIKRITSRSTNSTQPAQSPYYLWTPAGRGQLVFESNDYTRATEFLRRLDFANRDVAAASTTRWLQEIKAVAPLSTNGTWAETVVGRKPLHQPTATTEASVNTLSAGMLRKKRKDAMEEPLGSTAADPQLPTNVLPAGLVRKKPKS